MNPLQEYPHLFANGKFKVLYNNTMFPFYGCKHNEKLFIDPSLTTGNKGFIDKKYCTLIARPIEDMTDEENIEWDSMLDYSSVEDYIDTPESMLYLLSIGVYPFDQNHFGETVIDSTTL